MFSLRLISKQNSNIKMAKITRRNFVKGVGIAPLALNVAAQQGGRLDTRTFDFVVAGAGHNSLITAAYLAKAGYSVVVLEGRPTIGGGVKTHEVCLPGFKMDLCSSVHTWIQSNPALRDNELHLRDHGLEYIDPDPILHIPFLDKTGITIWKDQERTIQEYARHSKKDAETLRQLFVEWKAYRQARAAGQPVPMANIWRRRLAMSSYDLVNELFENEHIKTFHLALGRFSSVPGGDPGTGNFAFNALNYQMGGRPMPVGGSGVLCDAIAREIEAHDGIILTNMPVEELIVSNGKCKGVVCTDGTQFIAKQGVVSTIHIKHLVNMASDDLWGDEFLTGVDLIQPEYAMFAFHYAISEPVKYELEDGTTISPAESALMDTPERILMGPVEQATGEFTIDGMPLQVVCPSIADPTRAPEGHHTLKIEGNLPYELKQGPQHWDVIKKEVADKIFDYFRKFSPNLTPDKVLAEFLTSPLDIERWNPAMWKGSTHQMRAGIAQAGDMRPVPGWTNYRMPIAGLYQTGGCTGAGGSVRGFPGREAAQVILNDMGTNIETVVKKSNA
jgi:phytoene dehydrogenase-like protein